MKQHRNEYLFVTDNICPVCGEKHGMLVAKKQQFRAGKQYGDVCDRCDATIKRLAQILADGGIMIRCTKCNALTAEMEVPNEFQPFVTQMPDGTKRLEIPHCNNCKEAPRDTHTYPQTT